MAVHIYAVCRRDVRQSSIVRRERTREQDRRSTGFTLLSHRRMLCIRLAALDDVGRALTARDALGETMCPFGATNLGRNADRRGGGVADSVGGATRAVTGPLVIHGRNLRERVVARCRTCSDWTRESVSVVCRRSAFTRTHFHHAWRP